MDTYNDQQESKVNQHHCSCKNKKELNLPIKWNQLSYAGNKRVPAAEEPNCYTWPTYFIHRDKQEYFVDHSGNIIAFAIRQPDSSIDFEGKQLDIVKETLKNITPHQRQVAEYWGTGPATKQWTPIIDILIDTYNISAPRAGRILAVVQSALNDAFAVSWYFKFLWKVARPNQFDQNLVTILPTPLHPSYPSGHAVIAGCAQIVLTYFFEAEAARLKELAEQCTVSRLYAGVHYPIDNSEGLRLGRFIGHLVTDILKQQADGNNTKVDYPITESHRAQLPPPPYTQVIPMPPKNDCICNSPCEQINIFNCE